MKNLLFVLLALLAAPAKAQTTVPFHQKGAMILIDAQVNGHAATLLLDTGADYSIVSPEAAGVVLAKLKALQSTGGTGSEGDYVKASVDLRIGNRHWIQRPVLVMDMCDVSKRMGVKIDGFIAQDLLSGFSSVTIDYKNKTVSFN